MNEALRDLLDDICIVYLDDILVYSSEPEKHDDHVRLVLERLRSYGLYVKLSKCEFDKDLVDFLGYVVSTTDVSMEKDRVATIQGWPTPKSIKDLQVFLGFANFYRRFISHYSAIARPLTSVLKGQGKKPGSFY